MSRGFNYDLLVVAREMRGMTQAVLSQEAQITQGHLSKVENGLTEPSPETLSRLAEALDFPPSFFMQSQRIYSPLSVHRSYRKKASVSQKKLEQVQGELIVRLTHMKKLLEATHLSPELRLPEFDIQEYEGDAEKIAELVRRTWRLPRGPLQNLTECMERAGILISKCDFQGLEMDGMTLIDPECPPCVFINSAQPADRERFTLAHELGHIVMHAIPTSAMEDEANEFAAALLMPASDIRTSLSGRRIDLQLLARLKPLWKVSIQSLLVRSKTLRLITASQYESLWKQVNFYKMRKREPAALDFPPEQPEIISEILQLHATTLGYTLADFMKMLHTYDRDLRRMYDIMNESTHGNHLRLIS